MDWIKWSVFLVGHLGLWCVVFNRLHATALPRKFRKLSEKIIIPIVVAPVVWILAVMISTRRTSFESFGSLPMTWLYLYGGILLGCYFIGRWVWRKFFFQRPPALVNNQRTWIDVGRSIGQPMFHGRFAKLMGMIPFNEVSKLAIQDITLQLPQLPAELDGLRICQLSDLHFTGQLSIEYFHQVVQHANASNPDLIVITGDLIDETRCFSWLESTLGQLKAKYGVYYVLGNHDLRVRDESGLRQQLQDLGLIQTAGHWQPINIGDTTIQITGNELPWFKNATAIEGQPIPPSDFRILLTHSPDQIDWAKQFGFDLIFAGHTHGGQIAIPYFGPIVAPSRYGVLFASGTFQVGKSLMHVSRGISGDDPIRICSPPELGLFTLQSNSD